MTRHRSAVNRLAEIDARNNRVMTDFLIFGLQFECEEDEQQRMFRIERTKEVQLKFKMISYRLKLRTKFFQQKLIDNEEEDIKVRLLIGALKSFVGCHERFRSRKLYMIHNNDHIPNFKLPWKQNVHDHSQAQTCINELALRTGDVDMFVEIDEWEINRDIKFGCIANNFLLVMRRGADGVRVLHKLARIVTQTMRRYIVWLKYTARCFAPGGALYNQAEKRFKKNCIVQTFYKAGLTLHSSFKLQNAARCIQTVWYKNKCNKAAKVIQTVWRVHVDKLFRKLMAVKLNSLLKIKMVRAAAIAAGLCAL